LKPVQTIALPTRSTEETRIGTPLRNAPPPRRAVNSSPSTGAKIAPASTTPARSYAIETQNSG
jgi:hypothetical protein